jgi:hypothetical protein
MSSLRLEEFRKRTEVWSKLNSSYGLSAIQMIERGEDEKVHFIFRRLRELSDRSVNDAAFIIANEILRGKHRE